MAWGTDITADQVRAECSLITAGLRTNDQVNDAVDEAQAMVDNFLRAVGYDTTDPSTDKDVWAHGKYLACALLLYSIYNQEGMSEEYQGVYRDYNRRWVIFKQEVVDGYRQLTLGQKADFPTPSVTNIPLEGTDGDLSQFGVNINQDCDFPLNVDDDDYT